MLSLTSSRIFCSEEIGSMISILAPRESDSIHVRNCISLSKIKNGYRQELISHPMSENVDEFCSLLKIKLEQPFPDDCTGRVFFTAI